jgi:hypothetical protein
MLVEYDRNLNKRGCIPLAYLIHYRNSITNFSHVLYFEIASLLLLCRNVKGQNLIWTCSAKLEVMFRRLISLNVSLSCSTDFDQSHVRRMFPVSRLYQIPKVFFWKNWFPPVVASDKKGKTLSYWTSIGTTF